MITKEETIFEGGDMPDPIVREDASTEDECEAVCHKDENCEAWTWVSRVASTVKDKPDTFPFLSYNIHLKVGVLEICKIQKVSMREFEVDVSEMKAGQQLCHGELHFC